MRRTSSAAPAHPVTPAELIARISAERDAPAGPTVRHPVPVGVPAVVTPAPDPAERTRSRKLVPLVVGAVVLIVITAVVTTIPWQSGRTAGVDGAAPQRAPAEQAGPAVPRPGDPTVPAPALPAADPASWQPVGGDEFDSVLRTSWTVYDGGEGTNRRSAAAVTVENGMLVIRGDAAGTAGGLAWTEGSQFGRWEVRARFPQGDSRYHPALMLWPTDVVWPAGGEIDFVETSSASDSVGFVLHHGADDAQLAAERELDITAWHDYAVEWTPDRVVGYVDGERYFESADPATLPPGPMQLSVRLDHVPQDGAPSGLQPTEIQVDYVRMFR